VTAAAADLRIRRLRGPKPGVDPWKAHGSLVEDERRPGGLVERALTIFLTGAECPFTCSFCDLWRYTTDDATPRGALPAQIEQTLASDGGASVEHARHPDERSHPTRHPDERSEEGSRPLQRIKLYNASNFFDRRAVPIDDLPRIADLCAPFAGVTVESHASTVGAATLDFARRLAGRLEVAMGLETISPDGSAYLNKRLDLDRFDRAASFLIEHDADIRVFVLLGAPGIASEDAVDWTVRSAQYAAQRGAKIVSIIPVRGGNGEMERLASLGLFTPPTLRQLESALDRCLSLNDTVVTADLWDVEQLPACSECRASRIERLRRLNLTGDSEPPVRCDLCAQS
jgi:archaeosine synthase beta-subunit